MVCVALKMRPLTALLALALVAGCAATGGQSGSVASGFYAPSPDAPPISARRPILEALNGGLLTPDTAMVLSATDKRQALAAEYRALEQTPAGQSVSWQGASVSGRVVPAAPYQVGSQNCRQYQHTVTIGSEVREARGTACRNADGSWTPLT